MEREKTQHPRLQAGPGAEKAVLLLRVGEIFLKGKNRPFFARQLQQNVKEAIRGAVSTRLDVRHDRMFLYHENGAGPALANRLQRVFGLTGLSPAEPTAPDLPSILTTAVAAARRAVKRCPSVSPTFKVQAHRSDKRHPFDSMEVNRHVGAAIAAACGIPVNLKEPDLTVEIEITADRAFVFTERIPGPGGLPVGVSGAATLLLSGGIDSPVAGWMLLKRGLTLSAVTFHSPPYTGDESLEKVSDLAGVLSTWSSPVRLYTVGFTAFQQNVQKKAPPEMAVLLYRRCMLRTAGYIAAREGAGALATGESLGQVASQTLENLAAIQQAVGSLPVLRPLIAFDKLETVSLARKIGTYDISIRPHQDCCALFVPKHPETRARLDQVIAAEAELGDDPEETARTLAGNAKVTVVSPPAG